MNLSVSLGRSAIISVQQDMKLREAERLAVAALLLLAPSEPALPNPLLGRLTSDDLA